MKKYIAVTLLLCLGLTACDTDFLDRSPHTSIPDGEYFQNDKDMETYVNGFYDSMMSAVYRDLGSDNISFTNADPDIMDQVIIGNISSANVNKWTTSEWSKLRSINYFLTNLDEVVAGPEVINNYVGIARFFRARFYYDKVKMYSDVPWYNTALDIDEQSLYKAADSRVLVVDSVMKDLQFAVDHITTDLGQRTRITRAAALTLMTRTALHEGTYRKYHSELGLQNDYMFFIEKAIWACEEIMKEGTFRLYGSSATDYGDLFCSEKLTSNPEIILTIAADVGLGVANNTHIVLGHYSGLSRDLMETFLMKDGTPFTSVPGYDKKTFVEIFEERDPRLREIISYPGFTESPNSNPYIPGPKLGGYDQLKFFPKNESLRKGWGMNFTSLPVYRYAEVLLIYAEALAEKGTITQADLDNTINLIRKRVEMPPLSLATANANIDPVLEAAYPNVSGSTKGVLLEIRRERRVELACEGLRQDDLKRWGVGERFAFPQYGMYIPALGAYDMTGDGKYDLAILASADDWGPIAHLPTEERENISKYYLEDGFYLTNGTSGHIAFTSQRDNNRQWVNPTYYYLPVDRKQTVLNPQLKQPFGWK
ncbi:MAG: RagB/SusD family nutrient uptake outer membrane protein [Tannerellaceae bacterium]|nr:RagB/SusD family nutrient uptake outer membrane protein [Tannerellaceae bacterium]